MNTPTYLTGRRGAAIVDVLVVIGIVGVLISIVIPMMLSARDRANRAKCADNLRQIGFAMRAYATMNLGRLPTTRPTSGEVVIPDVTNSGYTAADPFALDGPGPNNVPSAFFLLIRTQNLSPGVLVCPNTEAVADRFDGLRPQQRSNFTSVSRNLSYSIQNPYPNSAAVAAGFRWTSSMPESMVLAADRNPGGADALGLSADLPTRKQQQGNSPNHGKWGQNVLYADGRVEFRTTPLAGANGDNIYSTRNNHVLDSPQDGNDSILLPAE